MHSRDITRASNTHDHCATQSMGILNAYGELANDVSLDQGVSTPVNLFHQN